MFTSIGNLLKSIFSDIKTTFITIFMIGMAICAIGAFVGDEHSGPKFKKGFFTCTVATVFFLLAGPVVTYIKTKL